MKKLLLFSTLLAGMSIGVNAQLNNTNVAISSYAQPSGTVYIDGNGNGSPVNAIEVELVNNDNNVEFGAGSAYAFDVTLDGATVDDPAGGGWVIQSQNALPVGGTLSLTITNTWNVQGNTGEKELCVSLNQIIFNAQFYDNQDSDKELCETFNFSFATSVADVTFTEISQVAQVGDMLKVFVKSNENAASVQLINLTGQVVKEINSSSNGSNFYTDINVSDLTAGIYMVNVISESGKSSVQKVYVK